MITRAAARPSRPIKTESTSSAASNVFRRSGKPLDASIQNLLRPHLDFDFGRIRVHSDEEAARSARALGAQAFTIGDHIVMSRGAPGPDRVAGQRLLAHEAAHVVHRAQSATSRFGLAPADASAEREADAWASAVIGRSRIGMSWGRPLRPRWEQWGPAWEMHAQRVVTPGAPRHIGAFGVPAGGGAAAGMVTVRTGEEIELPSGARVPDVIALEYSGPLSEDSSWVQFVWFEMTVTDPTGIAHLPGNIPTTSGTKPFTTSPAAPDWSVDSGSPNPFYEGSGENIRNSSSITIFDHPGGASAAPLVQDAVAKRPNATSVVLTAHFDTFLVQRGLTSYRVSWSASTAFAVASDTATSAGIGYTVGRSGRVHGLPADKMAVLHRDRPGPWNIS